MSKHRLPRSSIRRIGRNPLHLSVAAGVAGTVAVAGTVVGSQAPTKAPRTSPVAFEAKPSTSFGPERSTQQRAVQHFRDLREQKAARERAARLRAKRLAEQRAAERRAAARAAAQREAEQQAAEAREQEGASRSDARMSASAAHVLSIAAAQEGDTYVYGGDGPDEFDCSGFTMYVFGKVGIDLPHSSSAQADVATPVSNPEPGDLVFVHNGGGGSIGHVAIYAGDGYWYEASNPSEPVGKHKAWSSDVSYGRVL